jgi:O-succinylbenzoic acid--CoA ligase
MKSLSGLKIENEFLNAAELPSFCLSKLKNKNISEWEKKIYSFIIEFLNDSEYIIQESSGTTGTPKKFSLSKKAMIHSAQQTIDFFDLKRNQVAMLCLPVDYIAGKMMIVRAMLAGMHLTWVKPSSLPEIQQTGKIDFCALVPLQVINLIKSEFDFNYLRTLIIGGAELPPEAEKKLQNISTSVYETFGMAETCSHIALRRVNGTEPELSFTVLPNVKVSADERSCLVIEAAYLPGKVITNDIVELTSHKSFRWIGRIDNLINNGGIKISPEIVEKEIYNKTGCKMLLVGIPDAKTGHRPVLVTDQCFSSEEKERILNKASEIISCYHITPEINTILSLPDIKMLKTDRKKLTKLLLEQLNH